MNLKSSNNIIKVLLVTPTFTIRNPNTSSPPSRRFPQFWPHTHNVATPSRGKPRTRFGNIFHDIWPYACRLGVQMWPLNFAALVTLSISSSSLKRHFFRLNHFFSFLLSLGAAAVVIEAPNVQVVEFFPSVYLFWKVFLLSLLIIFGIFC